MGSPADDSALVDHDDAVGHRGLGQPVDDDDAGAVPESRSGRHLEHAGAGTAGFGGGFVEDSDAARRPGLVG